jgi:hypothetical protein
VQVLVHDVVNDDLPSESFALIHARFVLEHLCRTRRGNRPCRRMARARRCAGARRRRSFSALDSRNDLYRAAMQAWVDVLAMTGTDYQWARTFPQPLQRYGYREVSVRADVQVLQHGSASGRVGDRGGVAVPTRTSTGVVATPIARGSTDRPFRARETRGRPATEHSARRVRNEAARLDRDGFVVYGISW